MQKLHQITAVNSFRENRLIESHFSGPVRQPVNSPARIPLENNGEIRLAMEVRNLSSGKMAEGEGFEPPEAFASTVFKTAAFDHSATPPLVCDRPACMALDNDLARLGKGSSGAWRGMDKIVRALFTISSTMPSG